MALLPHSLLEGFVTGLIKDLKDSSSKIWHKEGLLMKESDQVGYSEEKRSRPKVWQTIIKKLERRKGEGPKDYKDLKIVML